MHLPIVWQWFPACRDFSVSLQASCKRRNQRQPRRCHTTAEDRLVWSPSPIPHPETQLNIAGSSKVPSREVRQANRAVCHRKLPGSPRAWALRANFANGRTCCGSEIDHGYPWPRSRSNKSVDFRQCLWTSTQDCFAPTALVMEGQYAGTALYSPTRVERGVK